MTQREYRAGNSPPEEERMARGECPVCGKPRRKWHFCCSPACTAEYWENRHPTQQQARRAQYQKQNGICAGCKNPIKDSYDHPYVLDHIVPIAAGGSQWDPTNHQVLCESCNKQKTARDMAVIAHYRRYHKVDLLQDATTRQTLLPFEVPA